MQDYCYAVADYLTTLLQNNEIFTCAFAGESSDFIRFNQAHIRQAGHVTQEFISLDLIKDRHHATGELTLTGQWEQDRPRLQGLIDELRAIRTVIPEDPFLYYATEINSSERIYPNLLPSGATMVEQILAAGRDRDLVGHHACGATHAGFANSLGQRNWYTRHSFNWNWSLYLRADKAVKTRYAGFEWQPEMLKARMTGAIEQLEALARPPLTLAPGHYRAYLTPVALEEIMGLLGKEGFGLHAHRSRITPLLHMVEEDARLNPLVSLSEHTAAGVTPDFQAQGFIRPPRINLIENGVYRNCLISPRSSAEYGIPCNGAQDTEAPLSIEMAPGTLPSHRILEALDTGLYIGNLWYLNYSDRNAARMTGMTRFATFWVENGRIQAPVNVMRFDDTLYHLLGDRLLAVSAEREMLLDPTTYEARSNRSARLPGILVEAMNFTL